MWRQSMQTKANLRCSRLIILIKLAWGQRHNNASWGNWLFVISCYSFLQASGVCVCVCVCVNSFTSTETIARYFPSCTFVMLYHIKYDRVWKLEWYIFLNLIWVLIVFTFQFPCKHILNFNVFYHVCQFAPFYISASFWESAKLRQLWSNILFLSSVAPNPAESDCSAATASLVSHWHAGGRFLSVRK